MIARRFMFLCAITLSAGLTMGGETTMAAPEGPIHGSALGHWDLPVGPHHNGVADGALFIPNTEKPVLVLHAVLVEHPDSHDGRSGGIKGLLIDPTSDKPAFRIKGIWKGPGSAREGKWDAAIFPLDGDEPVGKIGGQYTDPKPFKPGGDGHFKGAFVIEG